MHGLAISKRKKFWKKAPPCLAGQRLIRVKSGEFRVKIWCARRAGTVLIYCPVGRLARIYPSLVGASLARPCGLPVRLICRDGCNGRHICRPYGPTRNITVAVLSRAGRAPPLPCNGFSPHREITISLTKSFRCRRLHRRRTKPPSAPG